MNPELDIKTQMLIDILKQQIDIQETIINNLKDQIGIYEKNEKIYEDIVDKQQQIIYKNDVGKTEYCEVDK